MEITSGPLGDLEPVGQRRHAAGHEVDEANGRVRRTERCSVLLVAELVESQVQPGARAELQQPQRLPGLLRHQAEGADERLGAAGSVGLQRMGERLDEFRASGGDEAADGRPGRVGVAISPGGRELGAQLVGVAGQHHPMHAAEQPEAVPFVDTVVLVAGQCRSRRTVGRGVLAHQLEESRVEGRPDLPRHRDLSAEHRRQGVRSGHRCGP